MKIIKANGAKMVIERVEKGFEYIYHIPGDPTPREVEIGGQTLIMVGGGSHGFGRAPTIADARRFLHRMTRGREGARD